MAPSIRLNYVYWSLALSFAFSFIALADTATDSLIDRVQKRYNGARTLSVDFIQNYSILGHPRPPEAGTLTLRKQGKMRWDYSRPQGKLFVSDGKELFLYTARDNRVEKVPLKDTEDMRAPLAFLLGRLDMKKEFRDFQIQPDSGATLLKAAAKNDRLPYEKVAMLIDADASIRQLKVVDRDGSLMSFAFSGEKLNPPVADNLFRFIIPPGAEVVNALDTNSPEK